MCEKGPSPTTARTQERDGPEKEARKTTNDPESSRRPQVAEEIGCQFPGIDHDGILKQAVNITRDLAGAEEVRQSAYVGLLRLSKARRANILSLNAYVFASVRRLALRWRRVHRRPDHLSLDAAFNEKTVEDFAAGIADEDEINFMLNQLPKNCREGFVYQFMGGCTAKEVASRLGISEAAWKKRLERAMLKLAAARVAYARHLER